jgi:hypothetical protein
MESDDGLEEYIATFNAVLAEVGWVKDQPGTVRLFKDGLMLWLSRKMHQRDVWPGDSELTKWQELARLREVKTRTRMLKQELGGNTKGGSKTVRESRYLTFIEKPKERTGRRKEKERDPDAMDVDIAELNEGKPSKNGPQRSQATSRRRAVLHLQAQGSHGQRLSKETQTRQESWIHQKERVVGKGHRSRISR